jgi:uncharacterized protein
MGKGRACGEDAEPVAGVCDADTRMDETVMPIQGPPGTGTGTGKTHVTARAILFLVRKGIASACSPTPAP